MRILALRRLGALILAAPLALAYPIQADVVAIPPSKDNTLFENNSNFSSGQGLLFGGESPALSRRIVIAFDVAAFIPPGSIVNGAQLEMNIVNSEPNAQIADLYALHRLSADWGEGNSNAPDPQGVPAAPGDATWSHRFFNIDLWLNLGGDFLPAPSAVEPLPLFGPAFWPSNPQMVNDVQSWLDNPLNAFGWLIVGNEGVPASLRVFDSRETPFPPQLVVDFTPPLLPPPAVPDGRNGLPIEIEKLDLAGSQLRLLWDPSPCSGDADHHIIFGTGLDFPTAIGNPFNVGGGVCDMGGLAPFDWNGVPDPGVIDPTTRLLWFLILADDDLATEGGWGQDGQFVERVGPALGGSSGTCGITDKDVSNECGQGCPLIDYWATQPNGTTTIDFGSSQVPPIPPGFFEPGSEPFTGSVELKGLAIDGDQFGGTDTAVRRFNLIDLVLEPLGGQQTVDIQIVELHLAGVQPINVQGDNWVVAMGLSDDQPTGQLTATKTHSTGGTATSTVPVKPLFVFTRESELDALAQGLILPGDLDIKIFDFESEGLPPIEFEWEAPMPFSTVPPADESFYCPGETFFPGTDSSPNRSTGSVSCDTPGALPSLTTTVVSGNVLSLCVPPTAPSECTCTLIDTEPSCATLTTTSVNIECGDPGDPCPTYAIREQGTPTDCFVYYDCSACGGP